MGVFKMAAIKALVGLAFSGSIGLLFLFLACALPQFSNWYPFTVVIFYLLSPLPTLVVPTPAESSPGSSPLASWSQPSHSPSCSPEHQRLKSSLPHHLLLGPTLQLHLLLPAMSHTLL